MSRFILSFFNFTAASGRDLSLTIPICNVYAPIIDRAFPRIKHIGWRPTVNSKCYTYIKTISDRDQRRLQDFLELLHTLWCLTLTPHLRPYFKKELDEAYALDFNFKQGVQPVQYTRIGSLEHVAKENRISGAIRELSKALAQAIQRHPTLAHAEIIVGMPPRPSKTFHLADALVIKIGTILSREVGLALTKDEIPKLKNLPISQKVAALKGAFHLQESVEGKTVLIIDDLYQSGASVWSLAKFLKKNGAREVYCVVHP